jgi:hypothetical protein
MNFPLGPNLTVWSVAQATSSQVKAFQRTNLHDVRCWVANTYCGSANILPGKYWAFVAIDSDAASGWLTRVLMTSGFASIAIFIVPRLAGCASSAVSPLSGGNIGTPAGSYPARGAPSSETLTHPAKVSLTVN